MAKKRKDAQQSKDMDETDVVCVSGKQHLQRQLDPLELLHEGNAFFSSGAFDKAVDSYTQAAGGIDILGKGRGSDTVKRKCDVILRRSSAHAMMGAGNIEWAIKDARYVLGRLLRPLNT